jgi:imidazole glycerol-phosphate synthase subunit HisH
MITILDYGLGNIRAFANVYKRLNVETKIARLASDLDDASKLILPGVGSFDHAMTLLNNSGMREHLDEKVLSNKIPVMGICLGMQIMAKSSDEGKMSGLDWIDGNVRLFDAETIPYATRLPHMGWNSIKPHADNKILKNLSSNSRFYFLHSYYFSCEKDENILTTSEYGISFASAVCNENIYGIQFHPEKSHSSGIQLLKNFADL